MDYAQRHKGFVALEIDWFARNGYNLGLRSIAEWPPTTSIRILDACQKFLHMCPENKEVIHRRATCAYLCASLGVEVARTVDVLETQLQEYIGVRKYVQLYSTTQEVEKKDRMMLYDFEAAARLKDWDSLGTLVQEAASADVASIEGMADIIICSGAPEKTVLVTLKGLLDYMLAQNREVGKLARWIRSLVQVSLVCDFSVTCALLEQAIELVRSSGYPEEELTWLVGMSLLARVLPRLIC